MSYVIAVSAISGGGKTTLVNKLADKMNATRLFFDDYFMDKHYPQDIPKWLADGADLNEWECPELTDALRKLKAGEAIKHPHTDEEILPNDYIIFEEPTGKQRDELADLIDYLIVIDTPPEISLARRILRNNEQIPMDKLEEYTKEDLMNGLKYVIDHQKDYLSNYITSTQRVYVEILNQVKTKADLILDWKQTPDEMVEKVVKLVSK